MSESRYLWYTYTGQFYEIIVFAACENNGFYGMRLLFPTECLCHTDVHLNLRVRCMLKTPLPSRRPPSPPLLLSHTLSSCMAQDIFQKGIPYQIKVTGFLDNVFNTQFTSLTLIVCVMCMGISIMKDRKSNECFLGLQIADE
eukprot:scpid107709/ scgid31677/ 